MADGDMLGIAAGHQAFGAVPQASVTGLVTALAAKATGGQAAIADLSLASTGIGAVDTVLASIQTKLNTLLAELRTAGLLTP